MEDTDAKPSTSASTATRRNTPRAATKRRSFSDIYDTPNESESDSEFVPLKKNRKKLPKSEPKLSSKNRTIASARSPVGRRQSRNSQLLPSRSKAQKNLSQEPGIRRSSRERKPLKKGSPSRSPKRKPSQGKHKQSPSKSSSRPVGRSSKQTKKLSYRGFHNSQ